MIFIYIYIYVHLLDIFVRIHDPILPLTVSPVRAKKRLAANLPGRIDSSTASST